MVFSHLSSFSRGKGADGRTAQDKTSNASLIHLRRVQEPTRCMRWIFRTSLDSGRGSRCVISGSMQNCKVLPSNILVCSGGCTNFPYESRTNKQLKKDSGLRHPAL